MDHGLSYRASVLPSDLVQVHITHETYLYTRQNLAFVDVLFFLLLYYGRTLLVYCDGMAWRGSFTYPTILTSHHPLA